MSSPKKKTTKASITLCFAFLLTLLICMGGIVYAWTHPYTRVDKPFDNLSAPVSAIDRASADQKSTNKSPQVTKETSEDERKQTAFADTNRAPSKLTKPRVARVRRAESFSKQSNAKTEAKRKSSESLIPSSSAKQPEPLPAETDTKEPTPSAASPSPQASSTDQTSTPAPSRPEVTPTGILPDKGTIVEIPISLPEAPKRNVFRRFFGWVASLFKKKPKNGQLFISTAPGGFPVQVDGHPSGDTTADNRAFDLPAGKHTVEIIFPNGERWSREIDVVAGRKHYVNLEYRPKKIIISKSPCPYPLSISAPVSVNDGDLIPFTSDVAYGGSASLIYMWTVSPSEARIVSGAGTQTITVDSAGLGGQRVTATLVVDDGSGDAMCRQHAQASTSIISMSSPRLESKLFDRFQSLSFNDDKARLDNLKVELQNSPDSQAYIITYGPYSGEAETLARRSSDYLRSRGINPQRVIAIDGGCREAATIELWILPPGARPPQPSGAPVPCRERPLGSSSPGDNSSNESATPSPSPSPGATPTPPPGGEKDRITINYPQTVCFRHPETIRVVYDRVKGDFKVETRVENRKVETIISPETHGGLTGRERVPEGIRIARVTAIPTLVGEGFSIMSLEKTIEKSLEDDHVVWDWQITPKFLYRSNQPIKLAFQVNLYDQNNNLIRPKDWVRQDISVDVFICTNGELAAISAFFGAIAVALVGFGWKVMAFAPALFVRSVYNIYGGQQGAVGDQAQAINVTQQPGKTDSDNKGEKTDGKSGEG